MIEAVSRIGDYVQRNRAGEDLLSTFIENPNSNGKYKFVLIVVLNEKNGEYSFSHVDVGEFKPFQKYLYKKGAPNGTDATPTSKVAGDLEKTFRNRFLKWFQNYDSYDLSKEEKDDLQRMSKAIIDQADKISAGLQEKFSLKSPKDNAIITLGIEKDGELLYPGDIPLFKNILLRKGKDKYYIKKSQGESKGLEAVCSVCKERKDEVYGFAIPWTFHTFDKPGFIAGGFEVSESWKNTPVCFDCAKRLELGKKYIEERLDFSFYGFRYLLVPKLVLGGDCTETLDILAAADQKRKQRLNREVKNRLALDESGILEQVKDQKDSFSNSLLFYRKEQSSYRILLLIDGILPSRLRALFNAKERTDFRFKIYRDQILSEEQREKYHLEFNFGVLRRFFPSESRNRTFDKIFLEIVNKIFVGNSIDYYLIIKFIITRVRDAFKNEYPTYIETLNGFLLLNYLKELDLLRGIQVDNDKNGSLSEALRIDELERLPLEQRIDKFFESNSGFFNSYAKKAAFLEGSLAQKLINIQLRTRGSTPFRNKLHGLKMNEALIKRLLHAMQDKLDEYNSNYYRELEEIIASYFVLSGVNWEETDDELSFYFVLGMDMHKLFKNKKEEDDEKVEMEA